MSLEDIKAIWKRVKSRDKKRSKKVDVYKYLGVLKLDEDPVALQRKWREEWDQKFKTPA